MRAIHVLRKPCSAPTVAANVLRHGTGALNVDECRIVTGAKEPDSGAMYYKNRGLPMPLNKQNYFAPGDTKRVTRCNPIVGGRWPANLVLQHLDGCVQDGTRNVRSSDRPGHGHKQSPVHIVGPTHRHSEVRHRNLDGTETVAAWVCVEGCPVTALDGQSGVLKSGALPSNQYTTGGRDNSSIFAGGGVFRHKGYGADTGGASRFFKQVGGRSE